jgi:nucleoside 2-deoxyribosyltransferase
MYDVYWANSMFSISDMEFNQKYAKVLRDAGINVYLPQEDAVYIGKSPTETDIFKGDVAAVKQCKIFVACIDQETIDCGVACQIGIANVLDKYIIGFYSDSRKDRPNNKMYKNPHVMGAIKSAGEIVSTLDELLNAIQKVLPKL